MLVSERQKVGLTQRQLANPSLSLSHSLIALLESDSRGKRGRGLRREQLWYLIRQLKLWPPKSDRFLEAAGHEVDRSDEEERIIQEHFDFDELWVFARYILDPDDEWFRVVRNNLVKRGVTYRYFTENKTTFLNLVHRLKKEGVQKKILTNQLECTIAPAQFFISSFAIYLKKRQLLYCCGTKLHEGRAEKFYAMHSSEASRLLEMLRKWRDSLNIQQTICLNPLERIHPNHKRSQFVPEEGN